MPLLRDRTQVRIKQEANAGTAETLADADAILAGEIDWDPADVEMIDRNIQTKSLSPRGSTVGSQAARIRFVMHARGTSGAPLGGNQSDFAVPFKGCGLDVVYSGAGPNEIGTWAPSSTIIGDSTTGAYCTVAMLRDGKQYLIHGAQGNVRMVFRRRAPVRLEFDFLGVFNTPTDVALGSPAYSAIIEPPFAGASLSVLGFTTAKIEALTLDLGNQLSMRPYPNHTSGFFSAQITRRRPVFTFDPEEELAATKNWINEWIAATTGAITTGVFPTGGTNYNQFHLTIPKAQYLRAGHGDRDGIATAPIEGVCWANSDAGDDEFTFVQT